MTPLRHYSVVCERVFWRKLIIINEYNFEICVGAKRATKRRAAHPSDIIINIICLFSKDAIVCLCV